MFSVCVTADFVAKHAVTIQGVDETPHSHTWKVEILLEGNTLDGDGVLIDFIEVEKQLDAILAPLTNADLNAIDTFSGDNPSAERVAVYVGDAMATRVTGRVRVQSVTITEAPNCKATYTL
jgi:6-pyruvoyltetrahydropterin/6-carboxytetrahydropterin synthase